MRGAAKELTRWMINVPSKFSIFGIRETQLCCGIREVSKTLHPSLLLDLDAKLQSTYDSGVAYLLHGNIHVCVQVPTGLNA